MKYIVLILGVLFITTSGLGIWYYRDSQKTIETLTINNANLQIGIETNEKTILELQNSYAAAQAERQRINEENTAIRRRNNLLVEKFGDSDIGIVAEAKPELIERLINRGTVNAFRCLELLSGAELTDQERNARNAQEFNQECPWIFDNIDRP